MALLKSVGRSSNRQQFLLLNLADAGPPVKVRSSLPNSAISPQVTPPDSFLCSQIDHGAGHRWWTSHVVMSYNYRMRQEFDAVYENGLLRPLVPLNIPNHERVSLTVESTSGNDWLDHDALQLAEAEGDPTISLEEVRRRLATIPGSFAESVIAERGEY